MEKLDLSVVVPCFNEEENIQKIYMEIKSVLENLKDLKWELVFVDDGSTDNTAVYMKNLCANDHRVKVIKLSRNFGKEIAVLAGIDYAEGEGVVIIDADLQHPPTLIPQFLNLYKSHGYDIIQGIKRSRGDTSVSEKLSATLFYKLFNWLSDIKIQENSTDFVFLSEKAVHTLRRIREINRFNRGLFSWIGFKKGYIYFDVANRASGSSKFTPLKLIKLALNSLTSFSVLPLRVVTLTGLIISILSFLYGAVVIFRKLFFGINVEGYASLMVAVLFLGGLQIMFLGIVGEYIGRIYTEVKNRPVYVVEEIYTKQGKPTVD